MARPKRSSSVLDTARQRVAALKTFTPLPNFGDSLDLAQYEEEINTFSANLDKYNDTLTLLDNQHNNLNSEEVRLREKNKRVLAAVGAHYGLDSNEYEAAGGTRTSERKRPTRETPDDDDETPQS